MPPNKRDIRIEPITSFSSLIATTVLLASTTNFTLRKLSPQDSPSSTPAGHYLTKTATLVETSVQQPPLLSISQFIPHAGLSSVASNDLSVQQRIHNLTAKLSLNHIVALKRATGSWRNTFTQTSSIVNITNMRLPFSFLLPSKMAMILSFFIATIVLVCSGASPCEIMENCCHGSFRFLTSRGGENYYNW